jgi:hypothetical protein
MIFHSNEMGNLGDNRAGDLTRIKTSVPSGPTHINQSSVGEVGCDLRGDTESHPHAYISLGSNGADTSLATL